MILNQIKTACVLLTLAFAPLAAHAQAGEDSYSFLNVTSSARIYGQGGMNISLVDDEISTIDQNPALLGPEMDGQLSFNYMRYLGGSNFTGLRYGHAAGEYGAWSANVRYFGYGDIKGTTPDGQFTGTFSPKDVVAGGAYSYNVVGNLRGGIALNMLYSAYEQYTAFALSTDVGVNYYDPEKDLSLSLVAANMGGQLKRFDMAHRSLPFDLRAGASTVFGTFPVRFSVTAHSLTRWSLPYVDQGDGSAASSTVTVDDFSSNLFRHLIFGADLISAQNYYISLGYNYKMRTDMKTFSRNMLSGFSLGAGLKVNSFAVDLALSQAHTGGTCFMVNLMYKLNDLIN